MERDGIRAAIALAAVCGLLLLLPAASAYAGECPNEVVRTGYSALLPDCRAYELVTPPAVEPFYEGEGSNVARIFTSLSSTDGDRYMFYSTYGLQGAPGYSYNDLSIRGPHGWSTEDPVPPQSVSNYGAVCSNAYFPLVTPELTNWVLADGDDQQDHFTEENAQGSSCGTDEPELVEGEPQEYQNLFLHNPGVGFEAGSYQLIDTLAGAPEEAGLGDAWAQGASEDLSTVVFTESARLSPEAPTIRPPDNVHVTRRGGINWGRSEDLYVWSAGVVRLVTILPGGGVAVAGELPYAAVPHETPDAVGAATYTHAVSNDGRRIVFEAEETLYDRENPQQPREGECATPASACTVQLDAGQGGPQTGGGRFAWASGDGARVFFADERALTPDAKATAGRPDLYEYDFEAPEGARLTDLTAGAGEAGDVLGVSGVSEDGSTVYFVAGAALTGGQLNGHGASAQPGQPNLYVRHAGMTTFVATLGTDDEWDWERPGHPGLRLSARVSTDGRYAAFDSLGSPTGYDNRDLSSGYPDVEIYLYDLAVNTLSCASCAPDGERPTDSASIRPPVNLLGTIPENAVGYLPRSLSDHGQVFFESRDALLPRATNGLFNVYEYEGGQLHLISTGSANQSSYFAEASPSGEDVFFITGQELTPAFTASLSGGAHAAISVYDARVDGGFPERASPTACSEEDCRGAVSAPPSFSTPSSAQFVGAGNLLTAPPPAPHAKSAAQIRAEALARALRACRARHGRRARAACEALARRRYGPAAKGKRRSAKAGRSRGR